jgi:hypothetical protein
MKTRVLQDILRIEQIRLSTVQHPLQRAAIMNRIQHLAKQLKKRWIKETQTLTA